MEAQEVRQQGQETGPSDSCFPFPKGEQNRKNPSFLWISNDLLHTLTSLLISSSIRPLRTAAWGPPTSHLSTISYLVFGTTSADEKDMARLRQEGGSLGKQRFQKNGSQAPYHQPPYSLPPTGCLLGTKAAEGGAVHVSQELGPPFPSHLLLP